MLANSIAHYDDALSRELTEKVAHANLEMRKLGYKPLCGPGPVLRRAEPAGAAAGAVALFLRLRRPGVHGMPQSSDPRRHRDGAADPAACPAKAYRRHPRQAERHRITEVSAMLTVLLPENDRSPALRDLLVPLLPRAAISATPMTGWRTWPAAVCCSLWRWTRAAAIWPITVCSPACAQHRSAGGQYRRVHRHRRGRVLHQGCGPGHGLRRQPGGLRLPRPPAGGGHRFSCGISAPRPRSAVPMRSRPSMPPWRSCSPA